MAGAELAELRVADLGVAEVERPLQPHLAQWVFVDAQTADVRLAYASHPEARIRNTYNMRHGTSYASATLVRTDIFLPAPDRDPGRPGPAMANCKNDDPNAYLEPWIPTGFTTDAAFDRNAVFNAVTTPKTMTAAAATLASTAGSWAITISYKVAGSCTLANTTLVFKPSCARRIAKRTACRETSEPSTGNRIFMNHPFCLI